MTTFLAKWVPASDPSILQAMLDQPQQWKLTSPRKHDSASGWPGLLDILTFLAPEANGPLPTA